MGQGLAAGAISGAAASLISVSTHASLTNQVFIMACGTGCGALVDFVGDCTARVGKVVIHRDVVLNAKDILCHVYTFYTPCKSNPVSHFLGQKHEWLVLESQQRRYYTLQKSPATGDVSIDMRTSLRAANDLGLITAGQPALTGELRLRRPDMEFDVTHDVPLAYMIAWVRKEDPRWAFSTENSKHFTSRARYAITDY